MEVYGGVWKEIGGANWTGKFLVSWWKLKRGERNALNLTLHGCFHGLPANWRFFLWIEGDTSANKLPWGPPGHPQGTSRFPAKAQGTRGGLLLGKGIIRGSRKALHQCRSYTSRANTSTTITAHQALFVTKKMTGITTSDIKQPVAVENDTMTPIRWSSHFTPGAGGRPIPG